MPLASVFCDSAQCSAIQPVGAAATYYDVLAGGPPTFDVDIANLRRSFLRLQQAVHPDGFSQRGAAERGLAAAQSAWINHAYSTLKDPLPRARYLLRLHGREIGEDEQVGDPELLMEIMESREALEAATTESRVANLRQCNNASLAHVVADLGRAFGAGDLDSARRLTHRLQYLRRVAQAIDSWTPGRPVTVGQ
ncbi:molecular chaperone [Coemansia biformis]|uniref:Molecular chaperone n=1 Tax=Coemansia biformis TaxID=1286918 RepID=A0A9W7YCY2_9FUNG|nr:molecular chaperone [Coemansia biformis]